MEKSEETAKRLLPRRRETQTKDDLKAQAVAQAVDQPGPSYLLPAQVGLLRRIKTKLLMSANARRSGFDSLNSLEHSDQWDVELIQR